MELRFFKWRKDKLCFKKWDKFPFSKFEGENYFESVGKIKPRIDLINKGSLLSPHSQNSSPLQISKKETYPII